LSSQFGAVPEVQVPAWQVSAPLHRLPSLHDVPLTTAVCRQPSTGSQESVVHGLPSSQLDGVPEVQRPAWQVSTPLHTVAAWQGVLSLPAACWPPCTVLHESAVQALPSLQSGGVPAVQLPFWQVSTPLQALPSLQVVPLLSTTNWHPAAGLQESPVHGL